jgi:hypothetical protein
MYGCSTAATTYPWLTQSSMAVVYEKLVVLLPWENTTTGHGERFVAGTALSRPCDMIAPETIKGQTDPNRERSNLGVASICFAPGRYTPLSVF